VQTREHLGAQLGRYRLLSVLGRGGMGTVYLARHEALRSLWVAKVLRSDCSDPGTAIERFLREARAAASLRHPNIVQVVDVDCEDETPYLVMEHLEGEDLQARLRRDGAMAWSQLRPIALQVCRAMSFAHARNILHRDIKPANLYCLTPPHGDALIKVLDFGIAKVLDPGAEPDELLTRPGESIGTPVYMAPEQLQGQEATQLGDIYALGVVLYQLLTGGLPFRGSNESLVAQIVTRDPPPMTGTVEPLPPGLEEVVRAAMHRDPTRRIPSMARLEELLIAPDTAARAVPPRRVRVATQLSLSPAERAHHDALTASARARRVRWALAPALLICGLSGSAAMALFTAQEPAALAPPEVDVPTFPPRPPAPWLPTTRPTTTPARAPVVAPGPPRSCRQALSSWRRELAAGVLRRCGRSDEVSPGERITLNLTLDTTGQARAVQLRPSYYENDRFGLCLRRAALDLRFSECTDMARRTVSWQLVYPGEDAP